jgi:hypothetical protein
MPCGPTRPRPGPERECAVQRREQERAVCKERSI